MCVHTHVETHTHTHIIISECLASWCPGLGFVSPSPGLVGSRQWNQLRVERFRGRWPLGGGRRERTRAGRTEGHMPMPRPETLALLQ